MKLLIEKFNRFLNESKLTPKEETQWGTIYEMPISEERFLHFTLLDRAVEILESGKLLMRPPYEKFGTDTVDAVSTTYGKSVPGVQTTHIAKHIKTKEPLAAIVFSTSVLPHGYGFREEVKWTQDVPLIHPELLSFEEGVEMLENTPEKIDEDDMVKYYEA